jgi:hypothetical protein
MRQIKHTITCKIKREDKNMVYFLQNYIKSINEISKHSFLLLVSVVITVIVCCLVPALLQLFIILFVAFSK